MFFRSPCSSTSSDEDDDPDPELFSVPNTKLNISDCTAGVQTRFRFQGFPVLPPRLCISADNSQILSSSPEITQSSAASTTDSNSASSLVTTKKKRGKPQHLPPLGFFWDIENVQVPKSKSAAALVQRMRGIFLENYRESEFIVVCDVRKEIPQVIQELHDSQVNLIHVSATSKNAADEKLRQSLRRFAEVHQAPSAIVLISGDINFAADLSDLRYRKKIRVILVHNVNVADALILCANEHHPFSILTENLPKSKQRTVPPSLLTVSNLPAFINRRNIRQRLKLLTDNCGGRVMELDPKSDTAVIRFDSTEAAERAQRRIQGEDVFGNKIQATLKNHSGRKIVKTSDGPSLFHQQPSSLVAPPPGFSDHDSLWYLYQQDSKQDATKDNNNSKFRPIRRTAAMNTNVSPMEVCYEQQNWQMVGQQKRRQDDGAGATACALPSNPRGRFGDFCDEAKLLCVPTDTATSKSPSQPVDLIVTNLDTTMDTKELRRQLTNMLKEYAMILSLNITVQSDGVPIAIIRVNSQQEAQYTIFHLHRRRLGNKRIVISYAQNDSRDPSQLKAMVIGLLQEVPDKCLPLFKFIELFESRYHFLVSVAEVKKLKDIVKITDDLGPRIISLTHDVKSSPTPNLSNTLVPYCSIHSSNMQSRGWCETSNIQTPNIMMSLKLFANKLNGLLYVHSGCMHLLSFQICYEHKYNEPLPVHDSGVPLEHLISCVPNIEIKYVGPNKNIKVIVHEAMPTECNEESVLKTVPVSLAPNVNLLCRELVDLLKTTDRCQLLVNKFIPAYHHHFGRQCRVADYGYIRLLDLFESIPHVAQIMGDGTRRVITLTHAAQMRRFTSDLLRVLKVQSLKQISITDFPSAFEKVMNKAFNAVEYGLCMFEDLLEEVPENTVVVSRNEEGMMMISVPKRDQTAEEIMRTKQFAAEVIDLLKHSPYFKILFNKFVPAYHHHFGHQCKVSDYGFTKLIELFEAIPDVVEIEELSDGERVITLTLEQSLKVLGQQVIQAIKSSKMSSLQLETLPAVYLREMGYPLKPSVYQCESVAELVEKLSDYIEVIHSNAGTLLVVIDMDTLPTLIIRGWALLLKPPHYKDLSIFKYEYQAKYNSSFSNNNIQQLDNVFTITSRNEIKYIALTALYILAAQLYHMIYKSGGSVLFDNIEKLYFKHYGKPLKLSNYKIFTIDEFYNQFNALFFVRGKKRSVIVLKRNLSEHFVPLPPSIYNNSSTQCSWGAQSEPAGDWQPLPNSVVVAPPTFVKNSPPKPDTPPTSGTAPWNHWLTPYVFDDVCSLSIEMPIVQNPKLLDDAYNLISPAKNIWGYIPAINAPDPAELPMPDKLISKGIMSDDSTDSGVNTKLESSDHDVDLSSGCEQSGAGGSSQKPHFVTFLNFNN